MDTPPKSDPTACPPVLRLGRKVVEWYERDATGEERYGRAEVERTTAQGIAAAVKVAWQASGSTQHGCTLDLDTTILPERLLPTPIVPRKELTSILQRKAALQVGSEDSARGVFFLALGSQGAEGKESAAGERRKNREDWFLVSLDGSFFQDLRRELHHAGFRPQRVTSTSLSLVAFASTCFTESEEALLSIQVEEGHTALHLVQGERVLILDRIDGDLLLSPAVASAVVQAARNCVSAWKKRSRGAGIRGVVLQGLAPERSDLLVRTLTGTLPGVEIRAFPEHGEYENDARAGRFHSLACAHTTSKLNPNLSPPLAPERRSILLAGAAGLLLAAGMGWALSDQLAGRLAGIRSDRSRQTIELEALRTRTDTLRAAEAELAVLEQKKERLRAIDSMGLPLDELLGRVAEAFGGHADLLELSVTPAPGGESYSFHATAEADSDPLRLAAHLEALTQQLESFRGFESVEIRLPDRIPKGAALRFQVFAKVVQA